jgi:hypothetical protein
MAKAGSDTEVYGLTRDWLVWVITVACIVPVIACLLYAAIAPSEAGWLAFFALLGAALVFGCYLYAPVEYRLSPSHLIVHRVGPDYQVAWEAIASIEAVDARAIAPLLRVGGVGGLFGYFGFYWGRGVGRMRAYLTRRDHLVLVRRKQGLPLLLAPDDLEGFLRSVAKRVETYGPRHPDQQRQPL